MNGPDRNLFYETDFTLNAKHDGGIPAPHVDIHDRLLPVSLTPHLTGIPPEQRTGEGIDADRDKPRFFQQRDMTPNSLIFGAEQDHFLFHLIAVLDLARG